MWRIIGMKALDAFPGCLKSVFEDFYPKAVLSRRTAFAFPIVNGLDGAVNLDAGCDVFVDKGIGDRSGVALGFDGCPADEEFRSW